MLERGYIRDVHVTSRRRERGSLSGGSEPDDVVGPLPRATRERDGIRPLPRLRAFAGLQTAARYAQAPARELPVKRFGYSHRTGDVSLDENESRAQAPALVERDNVDGDALRRTIDVRGPSEDDDAQASPMT